MRRLGIKFRKSRQTIDTKAFTRTNDDEHRIVDVACVEISPRQNREEIFKHPTARAGACACAKVLLTTRNQSLKVRDCRVKVPESPVDRSTHTARKQSLRTKNPQILKCSFKSERTAQDTQRAYDKRIETEQQPTAKIQEDSNDVLAFDCLWHRNDQAAKGDNKEEKKTGVFRAIGGNPKATRIAKVLT